MATTPTGRVGANTKAELARQDKYQGDLAKALGLSHSGISLRLRGQTAITVDELVKTARFLGVPLTTLLVGVDELEAVS